MQPDRITPAEGRPVLNPGFSLRPLDLTCDIAVIHPWYQMDYAYYWNMQNTTVAAIHDFYAKGASSGHLHAYLGFYQDAPAFVVECYDPADDALGKLYPVQCGDWGMHFFVGPCEQPIRHFTRDILRVVMAFVFDHLHARRVIVEPDIRNSNVHRLNAMVGFVNQAVIEFPGKTAQLAVCTLEDFTNSLRG
jgi:hypothetical protein